MRDSLRKWWNNPKTHLLLATLFQAGASMVPPSYQPLAQSLAIAFVGSGVGVNGQGGKPNG